MVINWNSECFWLCVLLFVYQTPRKHCLHTLSPDLSLYSMRNLWCKLLNICRLHVIFPHSLAMRCTCTFWWLLKRKFRVMSECFARASMLHQTIINPSSEWSSSSRALSLFPSKASKVEILHKVMFALVTTWFPRFRPLTFPLLLPLIHFHFHFAGHFLLCFPFSPLHRIWLLYRNPSPHALPKSRCRWRRMVTRVKIFPPNIPFRGGGEQSGSFSLDDANDGDGDDDDDEEARTMFRRSWWTGDWCWS